MLFSPLTPDSLYYFSPLFPEVEGIEEAPPIDEANSAPQSEPQPEPPAKSIKKKRKIAPVSDDIDLKRTKSLLPLVTPERKRNERKYSDGFYEKRAANWQKKWEERKLQALDKEEQQREERRLLLIAKEERQREERRKVINEGGQRRIDFLNKFKGITFPANNQTH